MAPSIPAQHSQTWPDNSTHEPHNRARPSSAAHACPSPATHMEEDFIIHIGVPGAFVLHPGVLNTHRGQLLRHKRCLSVGRQRSPPRASVTPFAGLRGAPGDRYPRPRWLVWPPCPRGSADTSSLSHPCHQLPLSSAPWTLPRVQHLSPLNAALSQDHPLQRCQTPARTRQNPCQKGSYFFSVLQHPRARAHWETSVQRKKDLVRQDQHIRVSHILCIPPGTSHLCPIQQAPLRPPHPHPAALPDPLPSVTMK